MGLFDFLRRMPQPEPRIEWPPESSFVGLFLFNPSGKPSGSAEAVRKQAEAGILSSLSRMFGSDKALDALQPRLLGNSGYFMMGRMGLPGTTSCAQILERILRRQDGSVQAFDLRPTELSHFSFDSWLVCLMPLKKEQIRRLHEDLKGRGMPHYQGAVNIHASLREAVELVTSLGLGLLSAITNESIAKGAI